MSARHLVLFSALAMLAGCAGSSSSVEHSAVSAQRDLGEFSQPSGGFPIDIYDPAESFNRGAYAFNAKFDDYVLLPIVDAYKWVMPDFLEDRVSDFLSNLTEIGTFTNSLLQLNFDHAGRAAHRFFVNSTVGLLGFIDIATLTGYPQEREDFGQTLGVWGVGDGPYIVLPVLGPSNLRDAFGLGVDAVQGATFVPDDVTGHLTYDVGKLWDPSGGYAQEYRVSLLRDGLTLRIRAGASPLYGKASTRHPAVDVQGAFVVVP